MPDALTRRVSTAATATSRSWSALSPTRRCSRTTASRLARSLRGSTRCALTFVQFFFTRLPAQRTTWPSQRASLDNICAAWVHQHHESSKQAADDHHAVQATTAKSSGCCAPKGRNYEMIN